MTGWVSSIRVRIATALVAVSVLPVFALGLVVDAWTLRTGIAQLRIDAASRVDAALAVYEFTGHVGAGASLAADGAGLPVAFSAASGGGTVATWFDGSTMRAAGRASDSEVVVVAVDAAEVGAARAGLHAVLAGTIVTVAVLACLVGWIVAGSLTRRLRSAVHALSADEGEAVGSPARGGDEVDALVLRATSLTAILRERVDREQAFTADVAHELRTPLTGLVSAAELLPDTEEANRVRRMTARVRRLVDDLLELGRAEAGEPLRLEPVLVGDVVAAGIGDDDRVQLVRSEDFTAYADRVRLRTIIANVVGNALQHGRPPVTVVVAAPCVTVSDCGSGFPEQIVANGPRRFVSGGRGGVGLGLTIASSWAAQLGAGLRFENTDGGSRTTLTLPRLPLPPEDAAVE